MRAVLLGSPASERLARQPSEWARSAEWRGAAGAALEALPGLNASQRRAVAVALTRSFTLWQVMGLGGKRARGMAGSCQGDRQHAGCLLSAGAATTFARLPPPPPPPPHPPRRAPLAPARLAPCWPSLKRLCGRQTRRRSVGAAKVPCWQWRTPTRRQTICWKGCWPEASVR